MRPDESADDRTEAPTPRRLREARARGKVVVSRDLASALALLAAVAGFAVFGAGTLGGIRVILGRSLSVLHEAAESGAPSLVVSTGFAFLGAAAPLILFVSLAALGAVLAQVGFLFTGEGLRLRPERLDPAAGIRRLFSLGTFVGMAEGLVKGGIIFGILAASLWQERGTLAGLSTRPLPEAAAVFTGVALALMGKTALALLSLGLVDWAYRRWQHRRDLRMSRREIQDELREFDGDPGLRRRRLLHHKNLDALRRVSGVPGAAVVVTDDRDVAVALGRDSSTGLAGVVARGDGSIADRIREKALASGVPVIERGDLARALNRLKEVAGPIPAGLRSAASEAVALGLEMKGTGPRSG